MRSPIPASAQMSTFRHRNANYAVAVWQQGDTNSEWIWAAAGHSGFAKSSNEAASCAREWIKNGVHGAQRARL